MGFAVTRSESMLPFVQPTLAVCGSVTEIPTNVSGLLIGCPFFVLFFSLITLSLKHWFITKRNYLVSNLCLVGKGNN